MPPEKVKVTRDGTRRSRNKFGGRRVGGGARGGALGDG